MSSGDSTDAPDGPVATTAGATRPDLDETVAGHLQRGRERLVPWLLSLFLALGPVDWLPGVPAFALRSVEWILILPALGLVAATELQAGRRPFPRGILGPVGFLGLAVLWVPGLLRAPAFTDSLDMLITIASSAAMLWCFYCIAVDNEVVWAILRRSALIVSLAAVACLANELSGSLFWPTAGRWIGENFGGFAMRSTGWSIGLVMFLPASAAWLLSPSTKPRLAARFLGAACCMTILASQFVSRGRAGLLSGLLIAALFVLLRFSRGLGLVLVAVLVFGAGSVCGVSGCASVLRSGDLAVAAEAVIDSEPAGAVEVVGAVDQFTSRRLAGWFIAARESAGSLLWGRGLGHHVRLDTSGELVITDNLWLHWTLSTGILAPLCFLAMAMSIMRGGWQAHRDGRLSGIEGDRAALLLMVVGAGLVVSLFEAVPEGVQLVAVWWASAGALAGTGRRRVV